MKPLGLILITVGFFGAAFVSVRRADSAGLEWQTIEWAYYAPFFIAGTIGVIMIRLASRAGKVEATKLDADLETIESSLTQLVKQLESLRQKLSTMNVYDVHAWIDANLADELARFVEARESLITIYGLQPYANLMNEFAGSERNINRAWCASADGYVDEVVTCLDHATPQMKKALDLLTGYQVETTSV